jgi:hypothetical protein
LGLLSLLHLLLNLLFCNFWCWSLNLRSCGWSFLGISGGSCRAIGSWDSFDGGLSFNSLLELLINNLGIQGSGSWLFSCGLCLGHLNVLNQGSSSSRFLLCSLNRLILTLLINISEYIVQDKVASRLLCKDKGLDKLLELGGLVGCFTDNLNDDVVK